MDSSFEIVLKSILESLNELKSDVKATAKQAADTATAVATIGTIIKPLFDNGQPGLLTRMQDKIDKLVEDKADEDDMQDLLLRVESLEALKWKLIGATVAAGAIASALLRFLLR